MAHFQKICSQYKKDAQNRKNFQKVAEQNMSRSSSHNYTYAPFFNANFYLLQSFLGQKTAANLLTLIIRQNVTEQRYFVPREV